MAEAKKTNPVTDTDRIRWQRRAIADLAQYLADERTAGFPVLVWLVTATGGLVGRVPHTGTVADLLAAFDTWTGHLGLTRWPEHVNHDGWLHLHAVGTPPNRTTVTVIADIGTDDDGDGLIADPAFEEC
ncbi:hypothetical protein DMH03_23945 [Amycolatopsis sp. WAC 01376]|uniref:hypothetical protein n=1 Tax=Amycolatopsis sp. WAC 01376 TaxID=2203195 RepID=UPI000F780615|nr:hypothetical protein [Amycolatopsis sp. WAC 01376]RSM58954.1 hypothetical protein DMH03_23945 [Amycolatopsis sp. WAC 01376]